MITFLEGAFYGKDLNRNVRKRTFGYICPAKIQISASDQSAHSRILIRIFFGRIWIAKDVKFLHVDKKDSDQTARMNKLICVFVSSLGTHVRRYVF